MSPFITQSLTADPDGALEEALGTQRQIQHVPILDKLRM